MTGPKDKLPFAATDRIACHWDRSTGSRQRLSSVAVEPTAV